MFYDISASHPPRRTILPFTTFQPWQMFSNLLAQRRAYAQLSNLNDRMLDDIGISRGDIRSAIRHGRPSKLI